MTLAAACSFSSLIISAAALALGLGVTSNLALLGARAAHDPDRRDAAAHDPDRHDARRRLQPHLTHHLGRCSHPRLGSNRPPSGRLLGARAAHRPDRRDARRLQLQLHHLLGRLPRPRLGWLAQAASRCSARVQRIALTGMTLAAACSFSSLIISAAVLALGLSRTGCLTPLDARAAHRPDRRDARRLQLQLHHHLGRLSRPRLGWHRLPRAAPRTCSSSP